MSAGPAVAPAVSVEERFARVRETISFLRRPGVSGLGVAVLRNRLVDDLTELEELGALEHCAEMLAITYGGRA
ncbi:hypothetical protein ROE7235_03686 [Roseibaca ekhonensis]|jgi:hypothetical protein|uniref:Uncharacterized protein n=1 Tax=Roseinatronobacter ekhonensis TaxID=254356 RepID=A0A3B0MDF7_9RHOB|nr:hypothetical protein [Roseibaca ekhonensis]SUZ33905.1 hypothetical protein ROE7235_03686 [Roseibaca ekhonensis]